MLRHLAEVRHATCTGPGCRRPAARSDFEHNVPYAAGGRTCLCKANPKCRHDHRLKQDPRWKVEQLENGNVRWTAPSGRQYTTEPTRYPDLGKLPAVHGNKFAHLFRLVPFNWRCGMLR